jgi:DNA-binding PadR family transcriptional regulator
MRTPELKTIILRMTGGGEFYGYEMHKELEQRKINVGIGRLYSILTEMENEGFLKDRWEKSQSGPKRRVYKIGKKGIKEREKILMEAIRTVHEFYTEYLNNLPPESSVFNIIRGTLTKNLSKNSNIGYAATRFTGPLRNILENIRNDVPNGKKYAITPQAKDLDLGIEDVFVVEGTFEDIPMKDNHLDLLVVTGNIRSDCLAACLSEWRRVLTKEGILAIIAPTATITSYEDPLDIGEFIEQREHPRPDGEESLNSKAIRDEMSNYFEETEEIKVVHITVLLGLKPA